jgi:hypothetical protein
MAPEAPHRNSHGERSVVAYFSGFPETGGIPKLCGQLMEDLINMDDLGVPHFKKPPNEFCSIWAHI